jgi:hypothetical protein
MRIVFAVAVLLSLASRVSAETAPLTFVTEYVRELGVNEHMRELAEKDTTVEFRTFRSFALFAKLPSGTAEFVCLLSMGSAFEGGLAEGALAGGFTCDFRRLRVFMLISRAIPVSSAFSHS